MTLRVRKVVDNIPMVYSRDLCAVHPRIHLLVGLKGDRVYWFCVACDEYKLCS